MVIDSNNNGEIFFEDGLPSIMFDNLFYIVNYSEDSIFYIESEIGSYCVCSEFLKLLRAKEFKVRCGDYIIHRYSARNVKITKNNEKSN